MAFANSWSLSNFCESSLTLMVNSGAVISADLLAKRRGKFIPQPFGSKLQKISPKTSESLSQVSFLTQLVRSECRGDSTREVRECEGHDHSPPIVLGSFPFCRDKTGRRPEDFVERFVSSSCN